MKHSLIIIFFILIGTGFSQSDKDSLQLIKNDSLPLFNWGTLPELNSLFIDSSLNWQRTNSLPPYNPVIYINIPNCSKLKKRNGLFYLNQDSLHYCGSCVVLQNGENLPVTYYYLAPDPIIQIHSVPGSGKRQSLWVKDNFIKLNDTEIKIISSYKDGKRDGQREYYDSKGKLYKIESYKDGKLVSTYYCD